MIVPGSASPLLTTTDGGYTIAKSLRFRSSASASLSRTPVSTGDRQKWTFSAWVKRGSLGIYQPIHGGYESSSGVFYAIRFTDTDYLSLFEYNLNTSTSVYRLDTNQLFRDPSAWYHIVFSVDTTQATSSNRLKLYVNGVQVTSLLTSTYPTQNLNTIVNTTSSINYVASSYSGYFDGYMSDVYVIDGAQKAATDFGETDSVTGVWKPKAYSGTYGTNGFYLKFTDVATTSGSNAGLGKDFSGNGNYWTTNNISVTSGATYDSMTDVPTLTSATVANFAVMNPLDTSGLTINNGNLGTSYSSTAAFASSRSTFAITSGKFYWEIKFVSGSSNALIGLCKSTASIPSNPATNSNCYVYSAGDGSKWTAGTNSGYGASYAAGDVIGVAFDSDNGNVVFYKNNTSQGTAFTGLSGISLQPIIGQYDTNVFAINFGQQPFAYTPPTGYKALNTYNLPDSTIVAGNKYMDATTYTGNATARSITNAGSFKPDLVWMKARGGTDGTWAHRLIDSVRGAGYELHSSDADAESYLSTTLTAFNSNGFSLGTADRINQNGTTFVGWQWQAGQGTTSSNTSGSITSTVSVNASAGFSIVTFANTSTGSTIGHGLGVAPSMIIIKDRGSVSNWQVYHASLGNNAQLRLNTTDAQVTPSNNWNTTSPTSTVFTLGSGFAGTYSYVAYCWAEVAGFSKAFSYTGNGSSDGPFVYCGFRPKYVMIKRTDSTGQWCLLDTSRSQYNVVAAQLAANDSAAEDTSGTFADILSNGFKCRNTAADKNANGGTYIGMAFAENPFKNALAR